MYESDTYDGTTNAHVESEGVGSEVYRNHIITWRTGRYFPFRSEDGQKTSLRITSADGASRRITLVPADAFDDGLAMAKAAVDRNIDAPAARVKPSDIERDVIARWVMAQDDQTTEDWIEVGGWVAVPGMDGIVAKRTDDGRVRIENETTTSGFTFNDEQMNLFNKMIKEGSA